MIDKLRADLIADEGRVHKIYMCPAQHPTFGVGHMVKADDPECGLPVRSFVSPERVEEALAKDINTCIEDCRYIFPRFDNYPEEVQLICCNMMFNLGLPRFSKFFKFRQSVEENRWLEAAEEMRDSRWHRQLPQRSGRLINRMRKVAGGAGAQNRGDQQALR